jgi:NAD+ kinase
LKHIGLYIKHDEEALRKADALEKWLSSKQIKITRKQAYFPESTHEDATKKHDVAPADLFCVIVLGGDGTFLSASRWIGPHDIPLIGVKFGEIGFLAETAEENLFSAAEMIVANQFATEERMRLEVRVIRNETEIACENVLNEVVVNKGALARLANIETYIDDHYLTTYKSDGLIVASPTGSTAYSLAAGGPIIHPAVRGIILTPICPFTLTNRAMIVPETVCVKIKLSAKTTNIIGTFDGQVGMDLDHRDTLVIRKSPHPIRLISFPRQHYFDILKTKLRWSGRLT